MTTRFPFNISFKLLCLALFCGVLCCLAPTSRAQGTVLPLGARGFMDMGWAGIASVEQEAVRQASGPPYGEPRFRSMSAPHHAVFEGDFKPRYNNVLLAIFADDGADVSRAEVQADGTLGDWTPLVQKLGVGQALPELAQSFAVIAVPWDSTKTYRIRVDYKNIIYTLNTSDIDGLTLFAFNGGGTMTDVVVNINDPAHPDYDQDGDGDPNSSDPDDDNDGVLDGGNPPPLPPPGNNRYWNAGLPISGGRMKSPQDQRVNPFAPATITVAAGAQVYCEVESASDSDHWIQSGAAGDAGEGVTYSWQSDEGAMQAHPLEPGNTQKAMWTAPVEPGTYTLECRINDVASPVAAPATGTRNDNGQLVRTVTVTVEETEITFDFNIEKTVLLAGGLNEDFYKTPVSVVLKKNGQTLAHKSVSLTVFNSDLVTPALLSVPGSVQGVNSLSVVTNADGIATATLTSSKLIGATAKVKAIYGDTEQVSDEIVMADVHSELFIDADVLPADGQSTTDFYQVLRYRDEPVKNHSISFRISRVWDSNNVPVDPAADGSYPGYGTVSTVQGISDEAGVSIGTYTCGTLSGTIEIEGEDGEMWEKTAPLFASLRLVQASTPSRIPRRTRNYKVGETRPIIYVPITFFAVSDSAVPEHTTGRNTNVFVTGALNEMNQIWVPQVRIRYFKKIFLALKMQKDLEESIAIETEKVGILQKGQALLNVDPENRYATIYAYFIWKAHVVNSVGTKINIAGLDNVMGDANVFCVDSLILKAGTILSHEAGHRFNLGHIVELNADHTEKPEGIKYRPNVMYPMGFPSANSQNWPSPKPIVKSPWLSKEQANRAYNNVPR